MNSLLENVQIVLINTSHPGNIGASARAMKTMCLKNLVLVNPKLFPHAEATSLASGADDILANARVCSTLEEAIKDCGLVLGASARERCLSWPMLNPRQCAAQSANQLTTNKVAIVFGREHSGLTNEELACCHYLVNIPSNEQFSSLNVAAAVQIIAYELFVYNTSGKIEQDNGDREPLALASELQGFYQHLHATLHDIEFINPQYPGKMMRRLRRLFNRAHPNKTEINILRGILSAVNKKTKHV